MDIMTELMKDEEIRKTITTQAREIFKGKEIYDEIKREIVNSIPDWISSGCILDNISGVIEKHIEEDIKKMFLKKQCKCNKVDETIGKVECCPICQTDDPIKYCEKCGYTWA